MQFDFGKNWKAFSREALTSVKIDQAKADFMHLLDGVPLKGKTFLDIGFGQGLSILLARYYGAKVVGNDINPTCRDALALTAKALKTTTDIRICMGSILDTSVCDLVRKESPDERGFDIVHSWGVLHHTGNLKKALETAMSLVTQEGYCVLALYNTHWTSWIWRIIKWTYCKSPKCIQKFLVALLYPVIMIAKAIVTRQDPFKQSRGMDFYFDVVDWVGGYPYEYMTVDECKAVFKKANFECIRVIEATVPTGCNQFVFKRKS